MSQIQDLLDADTDNVENVKKLFNNFSPELVQAIEDGAQLFITLFRILDIKDSESENIEKDDHKRAKKEVRTVLALLSQRSYLWGTTDIYRTRLTSSMNHLRQQIESTFYMNLILDKPSVAIEWLNIMNTNEGKTFFRKYRKEFGKFLDKFDLAGSYNRISGTASHSRLSTVVYGLEIDSKEHEDRYKDIYRMKTQEVDPNRPERFILNVIAFLSDQIKLFDAFLAAFPEIDDPILIETRIPAFKNKYSNLLTSFKKQYPEMVREALSST